MLVPDPVGHLRTSGSVLAVISSGERHSEMYAGLDTALGDELILGRVNSHIQTITFAIVKTNV